MAGERTPEGSSDDEISLREHLQRQLDSQRDHFEQRLRDLIVLLDERYERQAEAIRKAEQAVEKRFDSVNEFRAQLNDQAHTFMPRTESISRHERTQEQLEKLEQRHATDMQNINRRLDTQQGQMVGAKESRVEGRQSNAAIYAFIGAAVAILGAIVIIANLLSNGG